MKIFKKIFKYWPFVELWAVWHVCTQSMCGCMKEINRICGSSLCEASNPWRLVPSEKLCVAYTGASIFLRWGSLVAKLSITITWDSPTVLWLHTGMESDTWLRKGEVLFCSYELDNWTICQQVQLARFKIFTWLLVHIAHQCPHFKSNPGPYYYEHWPPKLL